MSGKKRSDCGSRRKRAPPPPEKRVSYIIHLDDDDDHDDDDDTGGRGRGRGRDRGPKRARVSMSRGCNTNVGGGPSKGDAGGGRGDVPDDFHRFPEDLGAGVADAKGNAGGVRMMNVDLPGLDPDYKLFLELLRVDPRYGYYSLEVPVCDGLSLVLPYEHVGTQPSARRKEDGKQGDVGGQPGAWKERGCSQRGDGGPKRKFSDVSVGAKRKKEKRKRASESRTWKHDVQARNQPRSSQVENEVKYEAGYILSSPKEQHNKKVKSDAMDVLNHSKEQQQHKNKGKPDPVNILNSPKEQRNRQPDPMDIPKEQQQEQRNKGKPNPVDILNSIKEQKNKVRPDLMDIVNSPKEQQNEQKGKPGPTNILSSSKEQQNEQSCSDSDVMILDVDPAKSCTPVVVLDADDGEVNYVGRVSNCHVELLKLLEQPFDESELKALMEDFQRRLPVVGYIELRSGFKTFETKVIGLSYEDRYKDLADRIHSSNNKPKTLNLLRGFFHWLQNLTHGTMIAPWKDPTFLEVLPGGCSVNAKVD